MIRIRAVLVAALLALTVPNPGFGIGVDPPLDDPALEARAQELFRDLRCLVCQNQSISDSNADLARDLRVIVRERITAGDTDAQARAYVVDRYGDWVLLKPPFKSTTLLLWLGPLVLVGVAGVVGAGVYRGRKGPGVETVAPLDAEEQQRLRSLLDDTDDA
ncbi:MAG: cytochrome c-type biogenesis protein CcmH [Rhodospirillales bacterium]|nr:cytochrome c-type biogenesis protein CcmH [Rhodospirillales bacterium]